MAADRLIAAASLDTVDGSSRTLAAEASSGAGASSRDTVLGSGALGKVSSYRYLGATVAVLRHDALTLEELIALRPRRLMISPGPGSPRDAGICCAAVRALAGRVPILGVCLGLQCIFEVFGGTVAAAGEVVHGKASSMAHDGRGVFRGLPSPLRATRYHSLAGVEATLPACLAVSCRVDGAGGVAGSGMIQGVRHRTATVEGVQFHPESILTEHGHDMLRNFLAVEGGQWPAGYWAADSEGACTAEAAPEPAEYATSTN